MIARRRWFPVLALASCATLDTPIASAAAPPALSAAFTVNQTTAGSQLFGDVGANDAGLFTVVWQGPEEGTGNGVGVFLRRFTANGTAETDEINLNDFDDGTQHRISVAVNASGDVVSVWTSTNQIGAASGDDLIGRRALGGLFLDAEFEVEDAAYSDTEGNDVAVAADGSYLFVWEDDPNNDLRARRFGSNGVAITGDIDVNQSLAVLVNPQVAAGTDGNFFVAWSGSQGQVIGRCFDGDGFALGGEFFLRGDGEGLTQSALVAADEDGRFTAVWTEIVGDADDALYARRFDRDCTPLSSPALVAVDPLFENLRLDVAPDGAFVVAWERSTEDDDGNVVALEVTKDGGAVEEPFQVHLANVLLQIPRGVAIAKGSFVVVWDGQEGNLADFDVLARPFARRIVFTDGFEDGDSDGWSATQP